MENNIEEKLWDGCIEKMGGWFMFPSNDGLEQASPEERQMRMKHLRDTMAYTWNCHCFEQTFQRRDHEELRNPALSDLWERITHRCDDIARFAHAINYLNECINWSKIHPSQVSGISAMLIMTLNRVKAADMEIFTNIKQAIAILEEGTT
jgi:hypothetical protein